MDIDEIFKKLPNHMIEDISDMIKDKPHLKWKSEDGEIVDHQKMTEILKKAKENKSLNEDETVMKIVEPPYDVESTDDETIKKGVEGYRKILDCMEKFEEENYD